jgi:hypothetical protein
MAPMSPGPDPQALRSSSRPTQETNIVDAAWELLAANDERAGFDLTWTTLAASAKTTESTVRYHLKHGHLLIGIAERLAHEIEQNGKYYARTYTDLFRDLPRMDKGSRAEIAQRFRERFGNILRHEIEDDQRFSGVLFTLTTRVDLVGHGDADVVRDRQDQVSEIVRAAYETRQESYGRFYDMFCHLVKRTYVHDLDRTRFAVNAFLIGVSMQARLNAMVDDDELADSVMRIFWAHTKPTSDEAQDIEADFLLAALPRFSARGGDGTGS